MRQIDILWKLQEIENNLENEKKNLKELINTKPINQKIEMHKALKKDLSDYKELIEAVKEELHKLEKDLQEAEYKGEELKKKLYSGKFNELKQLGIMLKEQEKIEKKNIDINKEIEGKMEQLENFEKEIEAFLEKEIDLDKQIRRMVRTRKDSKLQCESKFNELSEEREKLLKLINKENLEIYTYIKSKKNNPIATIDSNICKGCHMDLPIMTLSKLNRHEIVTCNNCGRILYHQEG